MINIDTFFKSTLSYRCLYLKFRRTHNSLFDGALVRHFNQGRMIFFRKRRRDKDLDDNLFKVWFVVFHFYIFKTLDNRNVFRGDLSFLAKAEYIDARTGPYWRKKIFKRRGSRPFAAIFRRLVRMNDKPVDLRVYFLTSRECNLNFYSSLLSFILNIPKYHCSNRGRRAEKPFWCLECLV